MMVAGVGQREVDTDSLLVPNRVRSLLWSFLIIVQDERKDYTLLKALVASEQPGPF